MANRGIDTEQEELYEITAPKHCPESDRPSLLKQNAAGRKTQCNGVLSIPFLTNPWGGGGADQSVSI